MEKANFKEGNQ